MYKLFIACILSGSFVVVFPACNNATDTENTEATAENSLEKEVMAIHDEAMPMNAELVRLSENLMEELESNTDLTSDDQVELKGTIKALKSAEEAMMDWMASYSVKEKSGAELEAYLNAEKEKISQIKTQMEEALAMGKAKVEALDGETAVEEK
jgi:predicted RNase H-like nuclease (RuvC/YqgF family)